MLSLVALARRRQVLTSSSRCLFWLAYSAEGLVYPAVPNAPDYTVAPGCAEELGRRCTLSELMQYLWHPEADQTESDRPRKAELNLKSNTLQNIFSAINGYQETSANGKKTKFTGNLDFKRLFPDATDFYDALSRAGKPITAAKELAVITGPLNDPGVPGDPQRPAQPKDLRQNAGFVKAVKNLFPMAINAAELVSTLRLKDMESFRCGKSGLSSKEYLGKPIVTRKENPATEIKMFTGPYDVLDVHATLKPNWLALPEVPVAQVSPMTEEELGSAMDKYEAADQDHFKALDAARQARTESKWPSDQCH